jgi:DNA mismatch repair protein MutH
MSTLASVLEKLLPFVGKPVACPIQTNKGCVGILMEKLAGIPQTSNLIDCEDGEVKSFPLKMSRGTIAPKETVAVTMVQPESLLTVPFAESNVYKKLARTLYLPLLRDGDIVTLQTPVLHTIEPGSPLFLELEGDYNAICDAYREAKTLVGSTNLGKYLQTRTKGAGHGSTSRAFYLRTSFLKEHILS